MGVEIKDTILTCDFKGCDENTFTNATDKIEIEALGWEVDDANCPYTDEWSVYCPKHKKPNAQHLHSESKPEEV